MIFVPFYQKKGQERKSYKKVRYLKTVLPTGISEKSLTDKRYSTRKVKDVALQTVLTGHILHFFQDTGVGPSAIIQIKVVKSLFGAAKTFFYKGLTSQDNLNAAFAFALATPVCLI